MYQKSEKYEALLPQLKALVDGEADLIANLANLSAALHEVFAWWWVGFYWVKADELVLGPFQGQLPVPAFALVKVCVVRHGKSKKAC